jgi:hypothetical protein
VPAAVVAQLEELLQHQIERRDLFLRDLAAIRRAALAAGIAASCT